MFRSTFGGFTTAQLAMQASQRALDITGQNIANVKTNGYSRQRLDLISLNIGSGSNLYSGGAVIGQGVLVSGFSQMRDPFLDKRFRTEIAQVGEQDVKLGALNDLKALLDEVGKNGGVETQLSEITKMLQNLQNDPGNKSFDNMVRTSADVLAKLLNQYSNQIDGLRTDQEFNLENIEIPEINDILKNIADLNVSIKNSNVNGNPALELVDQRNLLIDSLASYVKIDVKYTPKQIGGSTTVEELSINFIGANGEKISLVDGEKYGSFSAQKDAATGEMVIGLRPTPPIKSADINIVNTLLADIGKLNSDIDAAVLAGTDTTLLLEQRTNSFLKLSGIIKIDSALADPADPNSNLNINFTGPDGVTHPLVDGAVVGRFDAVKDKYDNVIPTLFPAGSADSVPVINMNDRLMTGSLKSTLAMLNSSGEFDAGSNSPRGLGYYTKMLDTVANKLATVLNGANDYPTDFLLTVAGDPILNEDGTPKLDANGNPMLEVGGEQVLDADGKPILVYEKRPLFTNNDGFMPDGVTPKPITAKNISIAADWTNGKYGITTIKNPGDPATSVDNILHMITLFSEKNEYTTTVTDPITGLPTDKVIFNGTFQEQFVNTMGVLGLEIKSTQALLKNHTSVAAGIADSRLNVSAVSLDEEGINILQYQKSYSAAARLMTALDEALDTIINKMGIVGR